MPEETDVALLHSRIDQMLSAIADVSSDEQRHYADTARRLRVLEEAARGKFNDDPMMKMLPWLILLMLAPVAIDLVTALMARKPKAE